MMGSVSPLLPDVLDGLEAEGRKVAWRDDPVAWAIEYLGIQLWSKQKEMLWSIVKNRGTAVAAGHGVGKSFVAGVAVCWWVAVHPHTSDQTFVATTAPTVAQTSLIWDNVRTLYGLAQARYEAGLVDEMLPGRIRGDNSLVMPDGSLLGQGRKPNDSKADVAFQGRHAVYLLAIIDEAVGLSEEFLDAIDAIATSPFNRRLALANPTDPNCAFAKRFTDPKKKTEWNLIYISVFDSPAVSEEEGFDITKAEGLSGWDYINERREMWGEDDPRYISRVLGKWAFDAGNTVFNDLDISRAINTIVLPDPEPHIQQGWDIARMGRDATVGYQAREGEVWETDDATGKPVKPTGRRGLHIRFLKEWRKVPLVSDDPENLGSAERIDALARGEGAGVVAIDASGMGISVIDGLNNIARKKGRPFFQVEVYGSAPPSDRRAYTNIRAEQYFELKRRMFAGEIDLDGGDEQLLDELRGIVYEYNSKAAKKIESKDDMKKRGVKSPDRADALWYAAYDVSGLEDPLAQASKGDTFFQSPFALLDEQRYGDGLPV